MVKKSPIRVMVVDDSAFMRRVIISLLEKDPQIEIVGYARNGEDALAKVNRLNPDVLTMDVEMPKMNGLETLRKLMCSHPLPVVMLSSLTQAGAELTLQALEMGAVDFVAKPEGRTNMQLLGDELPRKVKIAAGVKVNRLYTASTPSVSGSTSVTARSKTKATDGTATSAPDSTAGTTGDSTTYSTVCSTKVSLTGKTVTSETYSTGSISSTADSTFVSTTDAPILRLKHPVEVVAIGTSTGGPPALQTVLKALPADFPAGVVIVQHMPRGFTGPLADRLNDLCALEVKEAAEGDRVRPGRVLIAPAGYQMQFVRRRSRIHVHLNEDSPVKTLFKPSVDVMLLSLLEFYQGRCLGVIMTGMGNDGLRGLQKLKTLDGAVLAQDKDTCAVYGMPRAAVEAGVVDKTVPLPQIGKEIVDLVMRKE